MDKHALAKKIRSLLAMTVENGASEAEAEIAWRKASQLMREHHMSMSEAEMRAEQIVTIEIDLFTVWGKKQPKEYQIKNRLSAAIRLLCGVMTWQDRQWDKFVIVGLESDASFAQYLIETLAQVAYVAAKKHIASLPAELKKDTRIVHRDFYQGFANGVHKKVVDLQASMKKDATTDGTSVVWVKNNIVEKWMEESGPKLNKSPTTRVRNLDNYKMGQEEGAKANLNRPVEFDEQKVIAHQK